MSSQNHMPHQIVRSAFGVAEKLEPLKAKKDPIVAAIAGFALGGVGLGIYCGSLVDFFVPWLMVLILMVLGIPFGELPVFFAPFFWAVWAYRRVKASNAKLDGRTQTERIIDAEVITEPPPIPADQKTIAADFQMPMQARLSRLDDLLSEGILSQAERDQKRAEILQEL
jgi:hypothetical protein